MLEEFEYYLFERTQDIFNSTTGKEKDNETVGSGR